jgi:UDP-N-acetylglucosamine--N-acetylmuramyl-(pentapeptide) pyrophosphoryl-undecaprenol N-acetylglucosamine transferase
MSDRVLIAGGGTAGHVFPALAVARELRRLADVEPVFVGVDDRLEARLVPQAGFELRTVAAVPVPRRPSPALLRLPGAVWASVKQCERIIDEVGATAVVTFGGYVSFPLSWAAGRRRLPLVVHEQNAVPGLANRLGSRWASHIAVSFPGSADRFRRRERCAVTGNPVRDDMLELDRDARRAEARERFGLAVDRPTLLVFGGSQGARSLNRAIIDAHPRWGGADVQILHAAGQALYGETATAWEQARASASGPRVRMVDFIEDMGDAYAAADVVLCRSGATSIAELTVLGVPAVLVPYPHATGDHQRHNAEALERIGAARVIADEALDGQRLIEEVLPLLTDAEQHAEVSAAARAFGRPDAATNVARLVLSLEPDKERRRE